MVVISFGYHSLCCYLLNAFILFVIGLFGVLFTFIFHSFFIVVVFVVSAEQRLCALYKHMIMWYLVGMKIADEW